MYYVRTRSRYGAQRGVDVERWEWMQSKSTPCRSLPRDIYFCVDNGYVHDEVKGVGRLALRAGGDFLRSLTFAWLHWRSSSGENTFSSHRDERIPKICPRRQSTRPQPEENGISTGFDATAGGKQNVMKEQNDKSLGPARRDLDACQVILASAALAGKYLLCLKIQEAVKTGHLIFTPSDADANTFLPWLGPPPTPGESYCGGASRYVYGYLTGSDSTSLAPSAPPCAGAIC